MTHASTASGPAAGADDNAASAARTTTTASLARTTPGAPLRPVALHLLLHTGFGPALAMAALGALDAWTGLHGRHLQAAAAVLLAGALLLPVWQAWALQHTWRATAGDARPAARGLRGLAVVALVLGAGLAVLSTGPRLGDLALQALGRDPLGPVQTRLSADGRQLQLAGALGPGSAAQLQAALAQAPQVQALLLQVEPGRLHDALQLAQVVRSRGLATRVAGRCVNGCALVFLAGARRQLLPGAQLGFHRVVVQGWARPWQAWVLRQWGAVLGQAGLSRHLQTKALAATPAQPWSPDVDELLAAGLVTRPARPFDVELPDAVSPAPADWLQALSANRLWLALDRRFPGSLQAASAAMQTAAPQGPDAIQRAALAVALQQLAPLLSGASPEMRWMFTEVLHAQVQALRSTDPAACRALLRGDATARAALPAALAWREADWLQGALTETPRSTAPRAASRAELEVMRRTVGARALQALPQLWHAGALSGGLDCERAAQLLDGVMALPAGERRLALRLMYERS